VNVHPTKNEVRFVRQKEVHDLVKRAVLETLRQADRTAWGPRKSQDSNGVQKQTQVAEESTGWKSASFEREGPGFASGYAPARQVTRNQASPSASGSALQLCPDKTPWQGKRVSSISQPGFASGYAPASPATQTPIWEKKRFSDLRIIGQLHNTYILCESKDELFLIDQHAAHERIVFEQLKKRSKGLKTAAQRLLIPETIDMGYLEAEMLGSLIPEFEKLGLEIEHFGGNTFVVKSVPGILSGRQVKPLIMEIVEKMIKTGFALGLEKAMDEFLILMACHSAIRANQPLTDLQIKGLLDQLENCENPSHCPHGRPTWIKWTIKDLEKSFGRIV